MSLHFSENNMYETILLVLLLGITKDCCRYQELLQLRSTLLSVLSNYSQRLWKLDYSACFFCSSFLLGFLTLCFDVPTLGTMRYFIQ